MTDYIKLPKPAQRALDHFYFAFDDAFCFIKDDESKRHFINAQESLYRVFEQFNLNVSEFLLDSEAL